MAIVKDKSRNTFYINYKFKTPDGKWQNINIRNRDWKMGEVGIRYMQSIEHAEIEKDKSHRKSTWHEGDDITLAHLCECFFRVCSSEGLDYETIYNYQLSINKYLYKVIPSETLADKAFTVENMDKYRGLLTNMNLAHKTINNKLVAVKNLIKFAKTRKFISREMADEAIDILVPLKKNVRIAEKDNFFTNGEEDLRKFVSSFDDEDKEWRVPIMVMFYGALRIGEWLAIERQSINFDHDFILINKQIDNHGREKNHTKTGHDRIVRLPHPFMLELKQYVEERAFNNDEYIFVGSHGGNLSRHKVRDIVNKHLSIAGVEHITLHGLRHSFATRMFDKGYDVKEVQEHLGHTSLETTLKYYIHYTQTKKGKDLNDLL